MKKIIIYFITLCIVCTLSSCAIHDGTNNISSDTSYTQNAGQSPQTNNEETSTSPTPDETVPSTQISDEETSTAPNLDASEFTYESINDYINAENVISVTEFNTLDSDNFDGYDIVFKNGEYNIKFLITVPRNYLNVNYPTVFYFSEQAANHRTSAEVITENGCICVTYVPRGAGSDGQRDLGEEEMSDVSFVMNLILESKFVDKNKIYSVGSSNGSILAFLTAKQFKDSINGVVAINAITDMVLLHDTNDNFAALTEFICGGTPADAPEEYAKRSAVTFANEIKCPVLLMNYKEVTAFSDEHINKMKDALEAAGGTCQTIDVDGAGSDFLFGNAKELLWEFINNN